MRQALKYGALLAYAAAVVWDIAFGLTPRGGVAVGTPQASVEEPPREECAREAHILFVGDIMAHLPLVQAAEVKRERYDFGGHFEGVSALFAQADYVVGNLETTLSPRGPYSGYPAFCTPEELARDMNKAGFDAVTLANNHALDRGLGGALGTLAALTNAGLESVGMRVPRYNQGRTEPLVVEVEGFRIALLAYTFGTNGICNDEVEVGRIDTLTMRHHIESISPKVDYIFALIHWGEEYMRRPTSEQQRLAEWMRQAGVDVVVGSHPHVVQPYEVWSDKSGNVEGGVFYSLGNFISNQNSPHTDYGLVASVRLRSSGIAPDEITLEADTVRRLRFNVGERVVYQLRVND